MEATVGNELAGQLEQQIQETNMFLQYVRGKMPGLIDLLFKILIALLIFFIGKKIIKVIRKIIKRSLSRSKLEQGSAYFIDSLTKAGMYIVLVAVIAAYFGVQQGSIAALLGSMGVGIVFALKESLANLAGGFILLLMKPFAVGDYIKEDNNENEGTVEKIDLFYTTLLTPDNRTISLPNGNLSNTSLTNISKQEKRQLRDIVGISYDADIKEAKEVLEQLLREDEKILQDLPREVFVHQLAESEVSIGWRAWVRTEDYWSTKWRLTEQIKYYFDKKGIQIPYNQLDVTIKGNPVLQTVIPNQEEQDG